MKYLLLAVLFFSAVLSCSAQGFFNQKGGQIKKYIEQIGLLKTYLEHAKKGYDIVDNGLSKIRDIKRGEFNLHDLYYKSLQLVNPEIRRSSKVDAAIETGTSLLRQGSRIVRHTNSTTALSMSEKRYIVSVCEQLMDDAEKDLRYLGDLITSDRMQLTDDERIVRIGRVYATLIEKSIVLQRFAAELRAFLRGREAERRDQQHLEQLYNLK